MDGVNLFTAGAQHSQQHYFTNKDFGSPMVDKMQFEADKQAVYR